MDNRKIIYLDDAIDAVLKLTYADGAYGYADAKDLVDSLENLPSAQPEQAVKGCRNCKYGKYNDHWKTNFCYNPNDCTEWNLWEPSAQPKQKFGKWVDDGDPLTWVCSECGYRVARYNNTPYCPNCGSKMINARGEQDETDRC